MKNSTFQQSIGLILTSFSITVSIFLLYVFWNIRDGFGPGDKVVESTGLKAVEKTLGWFFSMPYLSGFILMGLSFTGIYFIISGLSPQNKSVSNEKYDRMRMFLFIAIACIVIFLFVWLIWWNYFQITDPLNYFDQFSE